MKYLSLFDNIGSPINKTKKLRLVGSGQRLRWTRLGKMSKQVRAEIWSNSAVTGTIKTRPSQSRPKISREGHIQNSIKSVSTGIWPSQHSPKIGRIWLKRQRRILGRVDPDRKSVEFGRIGLSQKSTKFG